MADSVDQQIREQFPSMAWLLSDPEIGKLLRDAVNPDIGFSPQAFEAKVKGTTWYRTRNQAQRDWDILRHTDRRTAQQRLAQYTESVRRTAFKMGVNITPAELKWISAAGIQNGWDPAGNEIMAGMTKLSSKHPMAGAIQTGSNRAIAISQGEYFIPMSKKDADRWGMWIAQGMKTEQDLAEALKKHAISKFPYLKEQIMAGETPNSIFAPHKQAIAATLDLSPGEVNLMNGKWSKVLSTYDGNLGRTRPMTVYEAEVLARQDERYWDTKGGKEQQASTANRLLSVFGKRSM